MFQLPSLAELNLWVIAPAGALTLGACVLLLVDLFLPPHRKSWTPALALVGVAVSFVINLFTYSPQDTAAFNGLFVADAFTGFLNIVILGTAALSILLTTDYLQKAEIERGEYYILLLLSTAGGMFMVAANDLTMIFVSLELLSIPLYIMAAFRHPRAEDDTLGLKSEESGMKYFILGAFSSAFFVYGAALIYGATGATRLPQIAIAIQETVLQSTSASFLLLAGTGLALVGLGFKVAAVPFHMWTPDVYEGAPTPATAFMSVAAKVGGFAALLRLFIVGLSAFVLADGQAAAWQGALAIIAALTLILGNIVAIAQSNVKRLLAYSSIAHAGYILMAVAAAGTAGVQTLAAQSALVYLIAYMFTNLGAFAVAIAIEKADGSGTDIEDFVGLGQSRPLLAAAMAVFMLSLTGIPLTAGFIGKLLVFQATLNANLVWLAVVGVLTSVVSAFYYVRIIINMYLRDDRVGDEASGATPYVRWAVYAALAGTLVIGIIAPLATNLVSMVAL